MKTNRDRDIYMLLERYFECETTLEEERELCRIFTESEHIPSDLLYARALFGYLGEASQVKAPCGEEAPANSTGNARQASTSAPGSRRIGRHLSAALKITAVAAVLAVAVVLAVNNKKSHAGADDATVLCYVNGEAVTDYDRAAEITRGALGLIAHSVAAPAQYLAPLGELNKSFELLEKVSAIGQILRTNSNIQTPGPDTTKTPNP